MRPRFALSFRVPGKEEPNALFPAFVQTSGAAPFSAAVNAPVVPDESER